MKTTIDWIKANPLTMVAGMVAIISVVFLWIVNTGGSRFVERMNSRGRDISQLKILQRTEVQVPPAQPDEFERRLNIAVNQAAIDQLSRVYKLLNQEAMEIFKSAVEQNQRYHDPMLSGLFPEPAEVSKPFEVKDVYRNIFVSMLGPYETDASWPKLNAAPPPSRRQMMAVVKKTEVHYLASFFPPKQSVAELTTEEAADLEALVLEKLIDFLQEHAKKIHLYANTALGEPGFPFDVGQWSDPGPRPLMSEIWEGQVGLWIQRDIAAAISKANGVENKKTSVIDTVVKRLIEIEIVPGYVGLHGARGGFADHSSVITPGTGLLNPEEVNHAQDKVSSREYFALSPTGRGSNAIYDVRHVKVSLICDSQKLPILFSSLHAMNLMTILQLNTTSVDEYDALREGYFYGSGDVVRVDLLLESIWLRDWTVKLMPPSVRNMLGVQIPAADEVGFSVDDSTAG